MPEMKKIVNPALAYQNSSLRLVVEVRE